MQDPTLIKMLDDHGTWAVKKFQSHGNPMMALTHMREEIEEAIKAPYSDEEYADLLALIVSAWYSRGKSIFELKEAFHQKLKVNKMREWKENGKGYFNHIK